MDNNYFVLRIAKENYLEIYFYSFKSIDITYPVCFVLPLIKYEEITYVLSVCHIVNDCSTSHKFYLGKEIFKAQVASKLNQDYIQA